MSFHLMESAASVRNEEPDFTLSDISNFDFWISLPLNWYYSSEPNVQAEEKLSKFLKIKISEAKDVTEDSNELITTCLSIWKTQTLSSQNQYLFLKLISNMSATEEIAQSIKSTGLLKCVEEYSKSDSPKLFLEAWKILHNLVAHEDRSHVYLDGIYPIVPPWKSETPIVDVVLMHGIKGGASFTWRQHDCMRSNPVLNQHQRKLVLRGTGEDGLEDKNKLLDENYTWIWPLDWLRPSIGNPFRIIAVDYPAHWGRWDGDGENTQDLNALSEELMSKLKAAGVGTRPIVWIAHSMGGLIVKKMLANEASIGKLENVPSQLDTLSSTRAIVFLSVPHFGTPLASWSCFLAPLLKPSPYIYNMKPDCPDLRKNHQVFTELCERKSIEVLTLNETLPYSLTRSGPNVIFVPPKYGNPGVGKFYEIKASHLDICKPTDRSDERFTIVEEFMKKIFQDLKRS